MKHHQTHSPLYIKKDKICHISPFIALFVTNRETMRVSFPRIARNSPTINLDYLRQKPLSLVGVKIQHLFSRHARLLSANTWKAILHSSQTSSADSASSGSSWIDSPWIFGLIVIVQQEYTLRYITSYSIGIYYLVEEQLLGMGYSIRYKST
jgi:hypothetical protein